jgi:hypothetical protein
MKLIEPDELAQFSDLLTRRSWSPADFELREADVTDPGSDELLPMKGYVEVRRMSNGMAMEYPTGDGAVWVAAFARDVARGRFG